MASARRSTRSPCSREGGVVVAVVEGHLVGELLERRAGGSGGRRAPSWHAPISIAALNGTTQCRFWAAVKRPGQRRKAQPHQAYCRWPGLSIAGGEDADGIPWTCQERFRRPWRTDDVERCQPHAAGQYRDRRPALQALRLAHQGDRSLQCRQNSRLRRSAGNADVSTQPCRNPRNDSQRQFGAFAEAPAPQPDGRLVQLGPGRRRPAGSCPQHELRSPSLAREDVGCCGDRRVPPQVSWRSGGGTQRRCLALWPWYGFAGRRSRSTRRPTRMLRFPGLPPRRVARRWGSRLAIPATCG